MRGHTALPNSARFVYPTKTGRAPQQSRKRSLDAPDWTKATRGGRVRRDFAPDQHGGPVWKLSVT